VWPVIIATKRRLAEGAIVLLRKLALCLLIALAALVLAPILARADSSAQPVPADGQCTVPADPAWTPQEQFVWHNVCAGKIADFNKAPGYGGDLNPKDAMGLPDSRILRSSFLETLLLNERYRGALTRLGVRIIGARFIELLDLRNADIAHDLWLDRSLIEKGVNLEAARTKGVVSFDDSTIVGAFDAPGMQTGEDLSINRAAILGTMNLLRAHIGGMLYLSGSSVIGALSMNGIIVDQSVFAHEKARFKEIDLGGAHIVLNLELDGCTVTGLLFMNGTRIDQNLFVREGAQLKDVNLSAAHVGGQANLGGSTVAGLLSLNGARIDQSLFMRDGAQLKEIDLTGARIGGQIDLSGSAVAGTLDMYDIRVDDAFLAKDAQIKTIVLFGAKIGGSVVLTGAKVGVVAGAYIDVGQSVLLGGGAQFSDEIDLRTAKVGQDLVLSRGAFAKAVELNTAHVGGDLSLNAVQWSKNASLKLTNAAAATIDLSDSWPDTIYANGFTYRGLANLSKYDSRQAEAWLDKQAYASQPYEQLAGVLQANGLTDEATDIRYAGRERERREASGLNWVWLFLLNYSIGFGYHLEYAFAWALAFVLLGWAVLYATGQRTKHGMTLGLTYSFDMLLPLVQLNKKHDDVELDPWPQRYFYAHKLVGVLLTSFIVAGISGLTK
jgi:uncharacterized protein YjbI with pentapeptide repeats